VQFVKAGSLGTDDKMLRDTYSKRVKMSVSLVYNMVPPALERVLDTALDGDKECVLIYVYVCVSEL